jgi:hypothetical protein
MDAAGVDPARMPWNYGPVRQWLDQGLDPVEDIYPVVHDVCRRQRQANPDWMPGSLKYFERPVMDAFAERKNGRKPTNGQRPNGNAAMVKPRFDDPDWCRAAVRNWKSSGGTWPEGWGPPPGQADCRIPMELQQETESVRHD